jgi:type II secretory pathway pseudopilin PulG
LERALLKQDLNKDIMSQHSGANSRYRAGQSGFTLIEAAIAFVIISVLLAGILQGVFAAREHMRIQTTHSRMDVIMDALSAYAARNYRVPCPADPAVLTGAERNYVAADGIGSCIANAAEAEGIVPFDALGLSPEEVRDGWGNYITYRASPDLTADPFEESITVHARCRTPEWIEGERGKEPLKARFCCSGGNVGAEVQICMDDSAPCTVTVPPLPRDPVSGNRYAATDASGDPVATDILADPEDNSDPASFGVSNPFYPPQFYALNTTYPAYALISHGPNGAGAFIVPGGNRMPGGAGAREATNALATSNVKYALPRNDSGGANQFDDIVRWETQDMMLARLGRDSCATP